MSKLDSAGGSARAIAGTCRLDVEGAWVHTKKALAQAEMA